MLLSDRFFFIAIRGGASGRACLEVDSFGHQPRSSLAPFEIGIHGCCRLEPLSVYLVFVWRSVCLCV